MSDSPVVLRHRRLNRFLHWTTASCFLVLLGTGLLPIFGIKFNWVTPHWITGLVLIGATIIHLIQSLRSQRCRYMWISVREFVAAASHSLVVLYGKGAQVLKPGKYSVSQKVFHLAAVVVVFVAAGTGLVMMVGIDTPFWDRNPYFVTEQNRGLVFVAHGFATLVSVTMIIVHVYFAVRPEKRYFLRSMISGSISRRDYEDNHDSDLWKEDCN